MDDNSRKKSNVSYRPSGGLIFYGLLLVILVVFSVVMFGNNYGKAEETTLSDVVRYIESSDYEVTEVEVNGTKVVLNYHEKDSSVEKQLVQEIPSAYVDELVDKLERYKSQGKIESYNYSEPFDWSLIINAGFFVATLVIVGITI